jgi:hypothetical protein
MEPGVTFRRLSGVNLDAQVLRLAEGEEDRPPPVRWLAVILSLVLGAAGTWAVQRGGTSVRPQRTPAAPRGRQALILEVARLDEAFEARPDPTPEERGAYEARRQALLRRLAQLG